MVRLVPLLRAVKLAVLPVPDVGDTTPAPPVTVHDVMDDVPVFRLNEPAVVKAAGPLTSGFTPLVTLVLLALSGSSQLLRRVLLVPPPVQETNTRP